MEVLSEMGVLGLAALISGVVYVILASRTMYVSWFFGIVSCAIIAYEDFTVYHLIADGWLQLFYVLMGLIALAQWRTIDQKGHLKIQSWSIKRHLLILMVGLMTAIPLGILLKDHGSANLPMMDTMTSVFAVITTAMMVFRVRENWLYWIVINGIYLYIYGSQGAWFYVILTTVYTIVAIYGWYHWTRIYGKAEAASI